MTLRRKTGERQRVRQPLKIDRLPMEIHDRILKTRAKAMTWEEIERDSPSWNEWEKVDAKIAALFPGRKLPHSNLQRWYDLRVEQVQREVEVEAARAKSIADSFAARQFTDLTESAKNALGEQVFLLINSAATKDSKEFRAEISNLLFLLTKLQKAELDKAKLEVEQARLQAQRDKSVAMDPREMYLEAAQDLLKKLRTRKNVRELLDPIREELIAEFAHGAEAFAKQIEARSA
jgi:hypothetical protein